jgi:hypothetical protein
MAADATLSLQLLLFVTSRPLLLKVLILCLGCSCVLSLLPCRAAGVGELLLGLLAMAPMTRQAHKDQQRFILKRCDRALCCGRLELWTRAAPVRSADSRLLLLPLPILYVRKKHANVQVTSSTCK